MRAWQGRQQGPSSVVTLVLILGCMTFLFHDTLESIWRQWTDDFFYGQGAHGLPLLVILCVLVYRRWHRIQPLSSFKARSGALATLGLLSLIWAFGELGQVRILRDLAFYFMVFPLFWIVYGYRQGSLLAWPLILMITAFPVWDAVAALHREITTAVSARVLEGLGIPALREGFLISVPAGTFVVENACSGIAQLTSALAVTGLYAYLERLSLVGSAVLIALGWLVAIMGNIVRVVIIVVAGQATSMQSSLIHHHDWLGWVVFGVGISTLLWFVGRRLPQSKATSDGIWNVTTPSANRTRRLQLDLAVLLATLFAVAIGPFVSYAAESTTQPTFRITSLLLPDRVGPWQRSSVTNESWRPEFTGADAEGEAHYRDGTSGEVNVYVATYVEQRQGKEAVFDRNRVYDRARWRDARNPSQHQLGGKAVPRQVEETLLQGKQGGERLVWCWYLIGKWTLSGRIEAKLASIARALLGDRSARVVVVSAPIQENLDATRSVLREFAVQFSKEMGDSEQEALDSPRVLDL